MAIQENNIAPPPALAANKTIAVDHHGRVAAVAILEDETLAFELGRQYSVPASTNVGVSDSLPADAVDLNRGGTK